MLRKIRSGNVSQNKMNMELVYSVHALVQVSIQTLWLMQNIQASFQSE